MTNLANLPVFPKKPKPAKDRKYLAKVRELPCVICEEWGIEQTSPTAAHHCIHGRYSQVKSPDCMAIPLCEGHHQGLWDNTKIALHKEPGLWHEFYGDDVDYIHRTQERLGYA